MFGCDINLTKAADQSHVRGGACLWVRSTTTERGRFAVSVFARVKTRRTRLNVVAISRNSRSVTMVLGPEALPVF